MRYNNNALTPTPPCSCPAITITLTHQCSIFNPRPPSGQGYNSTAHNIVHCAVVLSFLSWCPCPHPPFHPCPLFHHHPLWLAIDIAIAIATTLSISPLPSLPSYDDNDMITTPLQLSCYYHCCLNLGHLSPLSFLHSSPHLASPSHLVTTDDLLDVTCLSGVAVLLPSLSGLSGLSGPMYISQVSPPCFQFFSGLFWHIWQSLRSVPSVMICLLSNGIFLFSLHHWTHLLFGMFFYDWIHCLLLFNSSNTSFIEL